MLKQPGERQAHYLHKNNYKDNSRFLRATRCRRRQWSNIFKETEEKYVNMIAYIENKTESTEKQLELRSEVCNVVGSKINIQKPTIFLYMPNEHRN